MPLHYTLLWFSQKNSKVSIIILIKRRGLWQQPVLFMLCRLSSINECRNLLHLIWYIYIYTNHMYCTNSIEFAQQKSNSIFAEESCLIIYSRSRPSCTNLLTQTKQTGQKYYKLYIGRPRRQARLRSHLRDPAGRLLCQQYVISSSSCWIYCLSDCQTVMSDLQLIIRYEQQFLQADRSEIWVKTLTEFLEPALMFFFFQKCKRGPEGQLELQFFLKVYRDFFDEYDLRSDISWYPDIHGYRILYDRFLKLKRSIFCVF